MLYRKGRRQILAQSADKKLTREAVGDGASADDRYLGTDRRSQGHLVQLEPGDFFLFRDSVRWLRYRRHLVRRSAHAPRMESADVQYGAGDQFGTMGHS